MKKVLVLGHFWPFHRGGSKRMLGLAKYFPEYGWEPIIITGYLREKTDREYRQIETSSTNRIHLFKKLLGLNPYRGFQETVGVPIEVRENQSSFTSRLVKLVEAMITYPDVEIGWKKHALKAAYDVLAKEKVDAIISVWPVVAHMVANDLKRKYRIPWVADFPDMWTYTYAYRYGSIRRMLDKRLECKTIKNADVLTTSSQPQAVVLESLHNRERVHTILMGYDPEYENVRPAPLTEKFTITYTGVLYGKERNPNKFLRALAELIAEGCICAQDVQVRFFGKKEDFVEQDIKKLSLCEVVKQYGHVSWSECLRHQRESQLLLQLNWENPDEKGAYSGKIAEYMAARRPVICVGGFRGDVMESVFSETHIGSYCTEINSIKEALLDYYNIFKRNGRLTFDGNQQAINQYSYREMAASFIRVIEEVK